MKNPFEETNESNENEIKIKLLKEMKGVFKELLLITEFGKRELKGISILSINKYMRRFFTSDKDRNLDLIDNKKHVKRKFEKTLLKYGEYYSEAMKPNYEAIGFANISSKENRRRR